MSYDYRYINKQVFKNSIAYTLLIEDNDGDDIVPSYRIEKAFKVDNNQIDEEFLRKEAKQEILKIIQEQENPFVLPPLDEIIIDE